MKRLQKGEIAPVVEATVLNGQRSMKETTSSVVRLAPGRSLLSLVAMAGPKTANHFACAVEAMFL